MMRQILPAYITSTVDTVPVIDIVLSAGEGPVGDFAGTSFVGGTNAVFTGIDLLNNEGMMWIFNADTGGGGVNRNAIIDTLNYNEVGAPNALFPSLTTIVGGEYIDRFTPTGWEQDDFSGGSLNRTGDLNTQLSFAVTPDLFAMVRLHRRCRFSSYRSCRVPRDNRNLHSCRFRRNR